MNVQRVSGLGDVVETVIVDVDCYTYLKFLKSRHFSFSFFWVSFFFKETNLRSIFFAGHYRVVDFFYSHVNVHVCVLFFRVSDDVTTMIQRVVKNEFY